jgi:hypothetical protein
VTETTRAVVLLIVLVIGGLLAVQILARLVNGAVAALYEALPAVVTLSARGENQFSQADLPYRITRDRQTFES